MISLIAFFIFLGFIISLLVFWIKTILEIANSEFEDKTFRILWILAVFFFPVVGVICWYLIGRNMSWQKRQEMI